MSVFQVPGYMLKMLIEQGMYKIDFLNPIEADIDYVLEDGGDAFYWDFNDRLWAGTWQHISKQDGGKIEEKPDC